MRNQLLLFIILLFSSCSFFDNTERGAMFLIAQEVALETEANQGANTHKIRDLSVYVDGINIGVFNVPSDIPILDEDNNTKVEVIAGIRNNGNAALPIEYPFYSVEEFDYSFEEGKEIPFDVNFTYNPAAKFKLVEGFEAAHGFNADIDNNPDTNIQKSTDARTGMFSGTISNSSDQPSFEFGSTLIYSADDISNSSVFLELDYKNEIPFQVGIIGYSSQLGARNYKIVLNASEEWNKTYIDLTPEIIDSRIEEFQLVFRNANFGGDYGSIWLDNVKIVHE